MMTPTETDRFLAEILGAAEGGAQIYSHDAMRLLRIIEGQGREVLRLRAEIARLERSSEMMSEAASMPYQSPRSTPGGAR